MANIAISEHRRTPQAPRHRFPQSTQPRRSADDVLNVPDVPGWRAHGLVTPEPRRLLVQEPHVRGPQESVQEPEQLTVGGSMVWSAGGTYGHLSVEKSACAVSYKSYE